MKIRYRTADGDTETVHCANYSYDVGHGNSRMVMRFYHRYDDDPSPPMPFRVVADVLEYEDIID